MAPRRRAKTRSYKADNISYNLGGERRQRSQSYRNVYLRSQLAQVQNHMQMAATQLGNDYNLEIHKLAVLQDEMARVDDLIAGWHDTEVASATARSAQSRSDRDYELKVRKAAADVANNQTQNSNAAAAAAIKLSTMPSQTRAAIQNVASQYQDVVDTTMVGVIEKVRASGEFANLSSLEPLQRQEAAVALKEALLSKRSQIPAYIADPNDESNIVSFVNSLTGVNPIEMTPAAYASARATFVAKEKRENSYAGNIPVNSLLGKGGPSVSEGERESAEGAVGPSDILKSLMDRRKALEDKLAQGSPDAPTYEEVRSLANQQYQPRAPQETRREYTAQTEQIEQMRNVVSDFPKDQRILMQAGRRAQRYADGDTAAIDNLTDVETQASEFIMDQLQNGTLSMNEIIPYATRIAEAGQMDGSPEDVVSARDRILSDSMAGLMASYRNTLPSNDVTKTAKAAVLEEARASQLAPPTQTDLPGEDLSFMDKGPMY